MARTGNVLSESTFEAIWSNHLPTAGSFLQHFWATASHSCFNISNDEAPMPLKAILPISWKPSGSLVVRWDTFLVCWLPVKCSLHWGPLSEGLTSSHGWESPWLRRPGPLFLRRGSHFTLIKTAHKCISPGSPIRAQWADPNGNTSYAQVQAVCDRNRVCVSMCVCVCVCVEGGFI